MRLAVVMDPPASFKPAKDSTYAMLLEAGARGHALHAVLPRGLLLKGGEARAWAAALTLSGRLPDWFELGPARETPLSAFDAVLMRQDPPFDNEYLYATHLLELAEDQGARVFNRPRALRDYNEKLSIARFPAFTVPTLVTAHMDEIRAFLGEQGDVVVKPLDGMGGAGVFRLRPDDPNLGAILETATRRGRETVMAQRYIPDIAQGDKRILLIDGQAVPHALARIPRPGETRGNLAAGGTGVARPLTARDREIADALAPRLAAEGLFLVGLDVIGDYLTEINVTSPTGFQEITRQTGSNVAAMFMDALERRVAQG